MKRKAKFKIEPLEEVAGAWFSQSADVENKLALLYLNQQKIYALLQQIWFGFSGEAQYLDDHNKEGDKS